MLIKRNILNNGKAWGFFVVVAFFFFFLVPSRLWLDQSFHKNSYKIWKEMSRKLECIDSEHKQTHIGRFCRGVATWKKCCECVRFLYILFLHIEVRFKLHGMRQLKLIENHTVLLEEPGDRIGTTTTTGKWGSNLRRREAMGESLWLYGRPSSWVCLVSPHD